MIKLKKVLKLIFNFFIYIFRSRLSLDKLDLKERNLRNNNQEIDTNDQEILNRIAKSFKLAKKNPINNLNYIPLGAWKNHIEKFKKDYTKSLDEEDIVKIDSLFKNFFRNDGIRGIWIYKFFDDLKNSKKSEQVEFIINIDRDYRKLRKLIKLENISKLNFPNIGNPWGYIIDDTTLLPTSCSHFYYSVKLKEFSKDIENPTFCEIGGGFGGTAYYLLKDRKDFTYLNLDIPEVLIFSKYLLMKSFKNRKVLLYNDKIDTIDDNTISNNDIILMPNFMLPKISNNTIDVTFNTRSLSEMNIDTINEYIKQINRITKRYFYHDNSDVSYAQRDGHTEIRSSEFNINKNSFELVSANNNYLGGVNKRFVEYLYKKKK
tara:strand:+ start:160 stop:1284 length:1125 start_codon:yes stop_codon:yes gene_type:complete